MRKRSGAALAAIVIVAFAAQGARAEDSALAQSRRQTFVVEVCSNAQHAVAIGAGVVVARDADTLTLATAAHIVTQQGVLRILDASRSAFYDVLNVQVIGDHDLALVRVRTHADFPIDAAAAAPAVSGERVFVWGHTVDGLWQLATGTVQQTDAQLPGAFDSPRITIACAQCSHGDSGSGVFDEQGHLLGVLTRAWRKKGGGPVLFIEVEPAALISQQVLATR
jgi:Trypsin-like peptidase domain